ncbi:hypothetical protein PPERSA_13075 [Pseudocohnilembus persalinus]|uniref:Uncharacterized protein n=1 Tax=Pseudocohnilembus persalinus TaxID=266149 RepID=A0A0V0QWM3_PSEPJ|nr:hypothetical protein PPERSA_13075 [Pseudocohnilembus persalinus]|eukprot:KRX06596.1 hypothetical protein PPERSA_13075 [Pseudocohnilembus persalinus]
MYNTAGYLYPNETGIFAEKNDLLFGWWSFFMCAIIVYQSFFLYPRFSNKVSKTCKIVSSAYLIFVVVHYFCYQIAGIYQISSVYYNIWYIMSYLKLIITLTKYMPQVYWNYVRKSTEGWSHIGVILDFTGGILSSFQILIDYMNGFDKIFGSDTSGLNIVKFGLSWISIFFDTIFLIQHYVLYNKKQESEKENLVVKNKNEKSQDLMTMPTNDTNREMQCQNQKKIDNKQNQEQIQYNQKQQLIPVQDKEQEQEIESNQNMQKINNQQYQAGEYACDNENQTYSGVFA